MPLNAASSMTYLDADGAGPRQRGQREGAQHQQDLGRDYQASAIDAINDNSGEQTDQQDRSELREGYYPEHRRRVRQLQHQPRLRGALHPGAGERGELAEEIEAIVAMAQRAKRAACSRSNLQRAVEAGRIDRSPPRARGRSQARRADLLLNAAIRSRISGPTPGFRYTSCERPAPSGNPSVSISRRLFAR